MGDFFSVASKEFFKRNISQPSEKWSH